MFLNLTLDVRFSFKNTILFLATAIIVIIVI